LINLIKTYYAADIYITICNYIKICTSETCHDTLKLLSGYSSTLPSETDAEKARRKIVKADGSYG